MVVCGNMYVGSSTCDRAVLDSAEVDGDTFRMVVGADDKENPNWDGCTADMGSDQYRAGFQVHEKLPDVVGEEQAAYAPDHSETEIATDRA